MSEAHSEDEVPTLEEFAAFYKVVAHFQKTFERPEGNLSPNDSLFAEGKLTAKVAKPFFINLHWYIHLYGYWEAANLLMNTLEPSENVNERTFYPILFLCRHTIELALKGIIMQLSDLHHIPKPPKMSDEHNLQKLWESVQNMLAELPCGLPERARLISKVLSQFTHLDPRSHSSRYGLQKDLATPSMEQRNISIENLQNIFNKLLCDLAYIIDEMDHDAPARR